MKFGRSKPDEPLVRQIAYDTTIGPGCKIRGDVAVRGALRLQGEVEGGVTVTGELDMDLGASVRGDVSADRARVAGRIEGDVRVKDSLELREGAHLRGDVYAGSFRIQDGAIFQGNCHMGRDADAGPGSARGTGTP